MRIKKETQDISQKRFQKNLRNNTTFTFNQSEMMQSNSHIPGKIKQILKKTNSKTIDQNYNTKGFNEPHTMEEKFDKLIRKTQRIYNQRHRRIGIRNQELKEKQEITYEEIQENPQTKKNTPQSSLPSQNTQKIDIQMGKRSSKMEDNFSNNNPNKDFYAPEIESKHFMKKKYSNPQLFFTKKKSYFSRFNMEKSKVNDVELGYLFEEKKINNLKKEINEIAKTKTKKKMIHGRKKYNSEHPLSQREHFRSLTPLSGEQFTYGVKQITINYQTSFKKLKQAIQQIKGRKNTSIEIKVPTILLNPFLFGTLECHDNIFEEGENIFNELGILSTNLIIKKYLNCILMIVDHISLICKGQGHKTTKIYLGGWRFISNSQGERHGIGLEWVPNKHVYYGEYKNNKKNGIGIMKDSKNKLYAGQWIEGNLQRINEKIEEIDPMETYINTFQ